MTKDDLVKYFETYINEYAPFKEKNVYQAILNYLVNYYYDNLYNKDPELFKVMFEEGTIPVEVHDKLLISIGLPQQVIDKLGFNSKVIFLKTFSDFERYKSTLSFVQKLATSYNDFINIYELYTDYIFDEELGENRWILRPRLVYKHDKVEERIEVLDYQEVYNEVPTLLVDTKQLDGLKEEERMCLPIKTNLILLDYNLSTEVSLLYNFIICTFLKSYENKYVTIYFNDFSYSLTIKQISYLWYYLLTKYYKTTWNKFSLKYILNFDTMLNTFEVDDLETILPEYELIDSRKSLEEFYDTYLVIFGKYHRTLEEVDEDRFHEVMNTFEPDLIEYIDDRFSNAINERTEIRAITNEIYNSIIIDINTSTDILYQKYSEYFLMYLSQISVSPEDTDTYLILYNLKPFHTELITRSKTSLYCEDKFNQVYIDEEQQFLFELVKASILSISDYDYVQYEYNQTDNVNILSSYYSAVNYTPELQLLEVSDLYQTWDKQKDVSFFVTSDIYNNNQQKTISSNVILIEFSKVNNIYNINTDNNNINELNDYYITGLNTSIEQLSDKKEFIYNIENLESNNVINETYEIILEGEEEG